MGKKGIKVVVTDYIEPDLEWEAQELSRVGIDFRAYQLDSGVHSDEKILEKISG